MLFKYKNCEKCGYTYDSVMSECPHCKQHNVDIEKFGIPQNIFWLQLPLQILLFVVCFYYGGMMLFANIFYALLYFELKFEIIEINHLRHQHIIFI